MVKKKTDETQAPVAADTTPEAQAAPRPARRRKKTTTAATAPEGAAQATPAGPAPVARKKAREKKTAAPKVETAAPEAPATPKAPKEDLVVFAFRLAQAERDLIHQTAGPRNATQFVRRVAAAFAHEDEAAFKTVIKEAREARS